MGFGKPRVLCGAGSKMGLGIAKASDPLFLVITLTVSK